MAMSCYNRDHPSRKSYGITQVVRHRRPSEAGIDLPRPLPHHRRPRQEPTDTNPIPVRDPYRTITPPHVRPRTLGHSRIRMPSPRRLDSPGHHRTPWRQPVFANGRALSGSPRHNSPPRPALAGDPPLVKHACGCTTEWILGHGWCRDRANAGIRVAHAAGYSLCDQTLTRSSAWMTGRCIVSGSSAVERPSMPASSVLSYSTTPRATIRLSGATRSTTSPP